MTELLLFRLTMGLPVTSHQLDSSGPEPMGKKVSTENASGSRIGSRKMSTSVANQIHDSELTSLQELVYRPLTQWEDMFRIVLG